MSAKVKLIQSWRYKTLPVTKCHKNHSFTTFFCQVDLTRNQWREPSVLGQTATCQLVKMRILCIFHFNTEYQVEKVYRLKPKSLWFDSTCKGTKTLLFLIIVFFPKRNLHYTRCDALWSVLWVSSSRPYLHGST